MLRRTRFDYGEESWTADLAARDWLPSDRTVGGHRISAAGIPASYVVRRDAVLALTLRVRESEWPAFLNVHAYGQSAETLTWYPDATDEGESYLVYWHGPGAGEELNVSRLAEYPQVFEVTILLRNAGPAAPWRAYYGAD